MSYAQRGPAERSADPLSEKRQPDAVGAAAAGASLPPGPAPLMVSYAAAEPAVPQKGQSS